MSLVLYRRHSASCGVHKLGLPAKAVRLYMDCQCPLWMFGRTENGLVPRQSTGQTDLAAAEALLASLEADGKDKEVHGPMLAECIERYLSSREHELGAKTAGHHKLHLGRLKDFCSARGIYHMRKVTVDIIEDWKVYGMPGLTGTSKSTAVAKIRCFLKDAYRRGWIIEPLVEKIKPFRAVYEQKEPYTDEEVEKILNEALKLNGGTHGYAGNPKTFRLLLDLMLETGMRVGDAVRFNPANLERGQFLWIYTFCPQKQKKGQQPKALECYISDRLKQAIEECTWLSPKLPFAYGAAKNPAHLGNEVYERMRKIGERCEVADCRPHRLRDTFAVRKLLVGFQLDDVCRLLGHSSVKITETYYARWTVGRKQRLERLVAQSLVNA